MARPSSKLPMIIIIIVVVASCFATAAYVLSSPKKSASRQGSDSSDSMQNMQLALPNTAPISFLHHGYEESQSIWVIVSKSRPLADEAYKPASLVLPQVPRNSDKTQEEQSLRPEAAEALELLVTDANTAGHKLFLASGFRSYELQKKYYDNYVTAYGAQQADTFSAKPGYSEHQTGLAFDLADTSRTCYLEICFEMMPSGIWLMAHAHEYGFILRYPKDKTAVTGYMYEPWHYRYVGKELAGALHESELTLDEALPYFDSAH